jgi:hypothetical protein
VIPKQHITEGALNQEEQGIVVPLELEGLRMFKQEVQPDGTIRIEVMGTNDRARCPHCQNVNYVCQVALSHFLMF